MERVGLPGSLCVCVCVRVRVDVGGCVCSFTGRPGVSECVPVDVWEGRDVSELLHGGHATFGGMTNVNRRPYPRRSGSQL